MTRPAVAGWTLLLLAFGLIAGTLWFRPEHLTIIVSAMGVVITAAVGLLGFAYRGLVMGKGDPNVE